MRETYKDLVQLINGAMQAFWERPTPEARDAIRRYCSKLEDMGVYPRARPAPCTPPAR